MTQDSPQRFAVQPKLISDGGDVQRDMVKMRRNGRSEPHSSETAPIIITFIVSFNEIKPTTRSVPFIMEELVLSSLEERVRNGDVGE
jgi:hypothetical protein